MANMNEGVLTRHTRRNSGGDGLPIGLATNPSGIAFQCPSCRYFRSGVCTHHDPRLNGQHVDADECCNRYEHPGMKVRVP